MVRKVAWFGIVSAFAYGSATVPTAKASEPHVTQVVPLAPEVKTASLEIMVLHGTQQPGPGSIDPQIGDKSQLTKPPFSSYNTYKLLGRTSLALNKGEPKSYPLVNGSTLQVTLLRTDKDGLIHLGASVTDSSGRPFLKWLEVTAAPNEPFFVAGQNYQAGILVLGFAVK